MVMMVVLICFLNLHMLVGSSFAMQVHDRVLASSSADTVTMLAIAAAGGLMLCAVLDYSRTRDFLILDHGIGRRLNRTSAPTSPPTRVKLSEQSLQSLHPVGMVPDMPAEAILINAGWRAIDYSPGPSTDSMRRAFRGE
jgi:ABC-type protease/lipase transport system fused ATPase/permease subunit